MQLKSLKLQDLYTRLIGNIVSSYPKAVVSEKSNYTTVGYAAQMTRIIIGQDESLESLVMRVTTDIHSKLSKTNSILIYISSLDELNGAKYAAQIIMAQKGSSLQDGGAKILQKANKSSHGYLLDCERNQIGVVDISRVPTNAYVTETDLINMQAPKLSEEERQEELNNRIRQGTIRRFFRR